MKMSHNLKTRNDGRNNNVPSVRKAISGCTVWFTGLSGAGKSTIAFAVEECLSERGFNVCCLDADSVRRGLNSDLGYSFTACLENVRRVAEVARLFTKTGTICFVSFITPHQQSRDHARKIHEDSSLPFIEIHVNTPVSVCEQRDVKGLYLKARTGQINNLVGIQVPFDQPESSDLSINTAVVSLDEAVQMILDKLVEKHVLMPYVGHLIHELFVIGEECKVLLSNQSERNRLEITTYDLHSIQVLSEGWLTPMKGFMCESEYVRYIHCNTSSDNDLVTTKDCLVVLPCSAQQKTRIQSCPKIKLCYHQTVIGHLQDLEYYKYCHPSSCPHVHQKQRLNYQMIQEFFGRAEWLIGGDLFVYERIRWSDGLDDLRLTPKQIRTHFFNLKTDAILTFDFHGIMHNGHLLLMQNAQQLLITRGYKHPTILIHPSTTDEIPLPIMIAQYRASINRIMADTEKSLSIVLVVFPERIIEWKNHSFEAYFRAHWLLGVRFYAMVVEKFDHLVCSHGQTSINTVEIMDLGRVTYDLKTKQMRSWASESFDQQQIFTNDQIQRMIQSDQSPPEGFMVNEAWEILRDYYQKSMTKK